MGRLSYILDSNILSEPSRPSPNLHVQSRLQAHRYDVCSLPDRFLPLNADVKLD